MLLSLLAVILLTSTTRFSLSQGLLLNCTEIRKVTKHRKEYNLDDDDLSKTVTCFEAENEKEQVHLMVKRDYHRRKRHPCDFPNLHVYDGCEAESYTNLFFKCKNEFLCRNWMPVLTSTKNCLKVLWPSKKKERSRKLGFLLVYSTEHIDHYRFREDFWKDCFPREKIHSGRSSRTRSQRTPTATVRKVRRPPPKQKPECEKTYTKEKGGPMYGNITSPGYPERNYSSNLNCIYKIELPENARIHLTFRMLELEQSKNGKCSDYIEVYDGFTSWSTLIRKRFCTDEKYSNTHIISPSNKLKIRFATDWTKSNKGFYATYEVYQAPEEPVDMAQRVTGVVIGTACGLVFLALTFLAICHSKRLALLHFVQRHYDVQSTGGPDVIQEKAPPSYDDVMASPEKYPVTPCSKHKEKCCDERPESEGPPPYPGVVTHVDFVESEMPRGVEGTELTHEIVANGVTGCQSSIVSKRDLIESDLIGNEVIGSEVIESGAIESDAIESDAIESDAIESDAIESDAIESDAIESDAIENDVIRNEVAGSDVGRNDIRKESEAKKETDVRGGGDEEKNDITKSAISMANESNDVQGDEVKVEDGSQRIRYHEYSRSITTDV